jgi:aquaporin Z
VSGVHWREAAIDGLLLGAFMVSAGAFGTLLYSPASPFAAGPPLARDLGMGLAMGLTAAAIFYSRAGQRSGAHLNPAVTLAFLRLGKIAPRDAVAYWVAQPVGGALGVVAVGALLGESFTAPPVASVATLPGRWGAGAAFAAELVMTFALFSVVLALSNDRRRMRWTGAAAATLVGLFVAFEYPVSGMSLNPARTFASALPAGRWTGFWIYLMAPALGMLAAAELFVRRRGLAAVLCAKLHHTERHECIFRCGFCRHAGGAPGIEGATSGESA